MSILLPLAVNSKSERIVDLLPLLQGFRLGRPFGILPKKKMKCPKGPRPNLLNVLRFYDQIGRCLSVLLSDCSGTSFLWYYIGKDAIPKVADDAIKSSFSWLVAMTIRCLLKLPVSSFAIVNFEQSSTSMPVKKKHLKLSFIFSSFAKENDVRTFFKMS
jgi:hypothetical protein